MTDNEIIKALECCLKGCNAEGCEDCPLYEKVEDCEIEIPIIALDLINRQKEEIAELKSEISILTDANENLQNLYREEQAKVETAKQKVIDAFKKLNTTKSETIREFAERLKLEDFDRCIDVVYDGSGEVKRVEIRQALFNKQIDTLVKEMTEETNGNQRNKDDS